MSGGTQKPQKDEKKAGIKPKPAPASGGTQKPKRK